jgi:adenylate cyclase
MLEIERRYKLNGEMPKDRIKSQYSIEQVYANINDPSVRIRKITDLNNKETYYHTVKYSIKKGIREEIETEITKEQYDNIFSYIDKKPVIKDRYLVDLCDGLVAEIDYFIDENMYIVEVEFPDEQTMNNFIKPEWFGNEITKNQSYSIYVFSKINNQLTDIEKLKYYINN